MNSSPYIFDDNFLLSSKEAERLYHGYVKDLPIIDYHNHLEPKVLYENENFKSPTQIWLDGDHYKWRAMRNYGVEEKYISGSASDYEKFSMWASVVPYTLRNPLFHWTHLELQKPFGIQEYLSSANASSVYERMNESLSKEELRPQSLLSGFKVQALCTTDDPADDLNYHKSLKEQGGETKVLPAFRPDVYLTILDTEKYRSHITRLETVVGNKIKSVGDLIEALRNRIDYFHEAGARVSDHGFESFPDTALWTKELEAEYSQFLIGNKNTFSSPEALCGYVLKELCKTYAEKGWVQQFHVGATRDNNSVMLARIGVNSGYDAIGEKYDAQRMSELFDSLNSEGNLAKTIIYNLNPNYNEVLATLAGNFNEEGIKSKVQLGAAWWFLDQLEGMTRQLNAFSNIGLLSTFVGMLTDSRSLLSFSRHDYFRRLLCNMFGSEMKMGLLPNDEKWIGEILQDVSYNNTKNYFGF